MGWFQNDKIKKKPDDRQASIIRANIKYLMEIYHTSTEQAAEAMGVSISSFYKKIKNPENIKIGELQKIAEAWGTTAEKMLSERDQI